MSKYLLHAGSTLLPVRRTHFMRRLSMFFVLAMVVLVLSACGTAASTAAPTSVAQSTQPPATALPASAPTAEAGAPALQTNPVIMDNLTTYTYATGLFSIDIPAIWSVEDRSTADEVLVRWSDPTENGAILIDLFEEAQPQSEEQLISILQDYLERTYQNQPGFSMDDPKPQSDGSILIVWGYDVELSGGSTARLLGDSFIEQRADKISVETIAVPDEQFDNLRESINAILNSYTIDPSVAIGSTASNATGIQAVIVGDLTTYTYATGLFSIDIPDNWSLKDTSKAGEAIVVWTDPTENGLIAVDLFEEAQPQTEDELVGSLQLYLQNTFRSQSDFATNDPQPQSDGSVLIVWSYTAEASGGIQTQLLGNSFIEQRGDKISILTTAVPDEQFEALLDSTNAIINSYTIDPTAALP